MSRLRSCRYFPGAGNLKIVFLLLGLVPVASAEAPLFASSTPLEITIRAPLKAIVQDRTEQPEYRPARLIYQEAGSEQAFDVGIRPRGKTRRKAEICNFPPLRVNFKTGQVKSTVFHGQDKLKLVTHCQNNRRQFQQYVLQEQLNYKILNLFTDISLKTRLARITYESTDSKKTFTSYAFFIEDFDQLASRTGYQFSKPESIRHSELDGAAANLIEVYQYLIGNTDWSMLDGPGDTRCCHNVILLSKPGSGYVPVPYDFDYSGIINTPYALPGPTTGLDTVRKRAYRGFCRAPQQVISTLAAFREKKDDIYTLVRAQPDLQPLTIKKTVSYLDAFYRTIDKPGQLRRRILESCR